MTKTQNELRVLLQDGSEHTKLLAMPIWRIKRNYPIGSYFPYFVQTDKGGVMAYGLIQSRTITSKTTYNEH